MSPWYFYAHMSAEEVIDCIIFLSRLNVVQKETMWSLILYVVCSMCMYVVCMYMYVYVCGNFCKIDHCIRIHSCIPMGLGHNDPWVESHMWPQQLNRCGVKGHLGVNDLWFKFFCKKGHCIHILWCIFMGLGHNDPWVESHMRPQQMWGQRSSRGHWPLVQVFAKRVTVSTYFDVFSWDLDTMILG